MRTYSFTLAGARLAFLLTITRVDGTIVRLTSYGKSIVVGGDTWLPGYLLEVGDNTETNRGDEPSLTFKVALRSSGPFTKENVNNRLFEGAEALLEITNAKNPVSKDYEFSGLLKGNVSFSRSGQAQFEILNKFALARDIFIREYTIEDDVDFGDPRRNKIPTFPSVDPTSSDLYDVARDEELEEGERRRFRYASAGNPSDYHNVYWEVTTAGTTGGSDPSSPSDTPDDTVTDGSATFTVRDAYARAFQVASIIDDQHITITVTEPRATDETWFAPGQIVMRSGTQKGRGCLTDAWDGTSQIELESPFARLLTVGDWGEIAPDYDQTLEMAVTKYGDAIGILADGGANNYRGFPWGTGSQVANSTFIPGTTVDTPDTGFGSGDGGNGGAGGGGGDGLGFVFESGGD